MRKRSLKFLSPHFRSSALALALLLLCGMDALRAIQESVEFIEAHLEELPQVPEIARVAGLSTAHFQRLFHALVGETVAGYARRRRLSRSVETLLETDRRVLDIAGFGVLYAALFRITRSILTMIPIAWAFVASIGSIQGDFLASSGAIGAYAIVVVIQLSGLAWLVRTERPAR